MIVSNIFPQLHEISVTDVLSLLGFVFSLAGVWLAARQNVLTWPVGLAGVALSMALFYQQRLYADVLLQVFYIGTTVYGWHQWLYGSQQHTTLHVTRASKKTIWLTLVLGVIFSPVVGFLFARFTSADVPYLDSALAVFSLLATVLMGRKLLENWLFWIVLDLIYTGLYFYKGLYLYSLLFFIFTLLAVKGYRDWKHSMETKPAVV